jgi:hypothetical protein
MTPLSCRRSRHRGFNTADIDLAAVSTAVIACRMIAVRADAPAA